MRTVLFAPGRASWIEADIRLLSGFGQVTAIDVLSRAWLQGFTALCQSDLCYFWFGSFRHTPYLVLAFLLQKKIIIVAGGYDVDRLDSINYGVFSQGRLGYHWRRLIFRMADVILAVSKYSHDCVIKNLNLPHKKIETIYLGFEVSAHLPPLVPWSRRRKEVILLFSAPDSLFLYKGVDRIAGLCALLPDVQFRLLGALGPLADRCLREAQPPNLELLGFLPFGGDEFIQLLNHSRCVCLPSRLESFGAAVIDGAVQGCVPVTFAVGALPEVVTGLGQTVATQTVEAMAQVIRQVVDQPDVDVERLRQKALSRFPLERRRQRLGEVFAQILPPRKF